MDDRRAYLPTGYDSGEDIWDYLVDTDTLELRDRARALAKKLEVTEAKLAHVRAVVNQLRGYETLSRVRQVELLSSCFEALGDDYRGAILR